MKKRGYCMNKSIWLRSARRAKRMLKHGPEAFQNQVSQIPKPVKIEAWGGPGRSNAPNKRPKPAKKRPRAPNYCPRGTQEASKRGQEAPQSSQKPAQRPTRATQEGPGPVQNPARRAPRRVSSRNSVGSFIRQAPGTIL